MKNKNKKTLPPLNELLAGPHDKTLKKVLDLAADILTRGKVNEEMPKGLKEVLDALCDEMHQTCKALASDVIKHGKAKAFSNAMICAPGFEISDLEKMLAIGTGTEPPYRFTLLALSKKSADYTEQQDRAAQPYN